MVRDLPGAGLDDGANRIVPVVCCDRRKAIVVRKTGGGPGLGVCLRRRRLVAVRGTDRHHRCGGALRLLPVLTTYSVPHASFFSDTTSSGLPRTPTRDRG